MARLSRTEKRQLIEATKRTVTAARPPAPERLSGRAYVEFATFAARFAAARKPVRFTGDHWKL